VILSRMLRNLAGLYQSNEDWERVARTSDRLLKLSPETPEPLRDRGLAYRELGYAKGAREDLARYLQKLPNAEDADSVRNALIDLGGARALLN
jgi:regulator of sirC expression with transglutaminase-like and TPR domain